MKKRLLLIMPNFFDYPKIIKKELFELGYEVDFFDDRPSTSALVKAVIRVKPSLLKKYISKYFDDMMKSVRKKKYDFVFIISGQSLSFDEEMIAELKESQSNAKFILYQWDSVKNFRPILKVQKYFDKKYSFDKNDCYDNSSLEFLPLFYCDRYEQIGKLKKENYKYDYSFVGTAHPKKFKFIKMMDEQLKLVYNKSFIYYFLPSKLVYFYRKIKNKEFKSAKLKDFHYVPLTENELNNIFINSKCILDCPQDNQVGLTIRVIETLGAKKKLITTNSDIVNYDFYRPENIYVYDSKLDIDNVFFSSDYVEIDRNVYEKYSLNNWLKEILN